MVQLNSWTVNCKRYDANSVKCTGGVVDRDRQQRA